MSSSRAHGVIAGAGAADSPRLLMKPAASAPRHAGHVDGAWWPRSRDLPAEVPSLFAALAARVGDVHHLAYNLTEWPTTPQRIDAGGYPVRLAGFRYGGANIVDVTGSRGGRLTLLVIPPETSRTGARRVSLAAADTDNVDSVDDLLALRGAHSAVDIPTQRC